MAAFSGQSVTPSILRLIAPIGGLLAGAAVAGLFLLVPSATLEDWVWRSGLPSLIGAAEPPLGTTARAVLALAGGTTAAAVAWSALFLLFGADGLLAPKAATADGVPVLRRADAHPDAPARKPLSAADLDLPFDAMQAAAARRVAPPPPPVVQPIPVDLDQPLAAFHPGALPDVPREPVRPVPPLRPAVALADGERIATVQLPRSPAESHGAPSIESLLKRLEQSARGPLRA